MKTPEEINEMNKKFWDQQNAEFEALAKKYPEELKQAANLAAKLVKHNLASEVDFVDECSLNVAMHQVSEIDSRKQSRRAKNPRPKKTPTLASIVIAKMKTARAAGQTLNEFIDCADNGSLNNFEIKKPKGRSVRYEIYDEETGEYKKVAFSTLEGYWTKSSKYLP